MFWIKKNPNGKGHPLLSNNCHSYKKGKNKTTSLTNNLWRERQIRDYKGDHGLCYLYDESYDANHKVMCTKKPQPQAQVNAFGTILSY
jgi:hypothetical protein